MNSRSIGDLDRNIIIDKKVARGMNGTLILYLYFTLIPVS